MEWLVLKRKVFLVPVLSMQYSQMSFIMILILKSKIKILLLGVFLTAEVIYFIKLFATVTLLSATTFILRGKIIVKVRCFN